MKCCNSSGSSCNHENPCRFFAQYSVYANPPSGTDLPMSVVFQEGDQIRLNGDSQIIFAPGFLYLVDYLFLATTEADNYMQITPRINGSLRLLYSFYAPAGSGGRNTSASGSFTTNEAIAQESSLAFYLTFPSAVRNIDISGAISVTPLVKM